MKDLRVDTTTKAVALDESRSALSTGRWYFDPSRLKFDNVSARIAFDAAPVAIALCDLAGDLVHANRLFTELLDLGPLEVAVGRNLAELCPLLDLGMIEVLARERSAHHTVSTLIDKPSGRSQRVLCSGRRVDGAELTPRWLVWVLTPLPETDTAQFSQAFSEAERRCGVAHWSMRCSDPIQVDALPMSWSPGASAMFALREGRALKTCGDWLTLISPDDSYKVRQSLSALAYDGTAFDIEYALTTGSKGQRRTVRSRGWRTQFDDGVFTLLGTEQIIAEAQPNEHEFHQAVGLFKSLFEESDWLACIVDPQLRLQYGNLAFQSLLGGKSTVGEFSGAKLPQVIREIGARRAITVNIRYALLGQRRAQVIELEIPDAQRRWFDLSFFPLKSADGQCVGTSIIGTALAAKPNQAHS